MQISKLQQENDYHIKDKEKIRNQLRKAESHPINKNGETLDKKFLSKLK